MLAPPERKVVVVAAGDLVLAPVAEQPVLALEAGERVVAGAAVCRVVAGGEEQVVGVVAAIDLVDAAAAEERVCAVAAVELGRHGLGGLFEHGVVARAAVVDVDPEPAIEEVVAGAADQYVVAAIGEDRVVAGAAGEAVGAVGRVDPILAIGADDILDIGDVLGPEAKENLADGEIGAVKEPGPEREVQRVDPVAAIVQAAVERAVADAQHVVACAAIDGIVPGAVDEAVVPRSSIEGVVAGPAVQDVVPVIGVHDVIARAGEHAVLARADEDEEGAAEGGVVAAEKVEDVERVRDVPKRVSLPAVPVMSAMISLLKQGVSGRVCPTGGRLGAGSARNDLSRRQASGGNG